MSIIIPYDKKLETNDGAFIEPNGKIIYTYGEHLRYAMDYCNGKNESAPRMTKEELELYERYLDDFSFSRRYDYSDFLVLLLHFDKVETIMKKCITTSDLEPHVRFYNYYLMDWRVDNQLPMRYDYESDRFVKCGSLDMVTSQEEREAEDSIENIKKKVLVKDRHLFFK
jgi:hypothetical protein